MAYRDDITITSTHTITSAAKKYIQPYLHKVFTWTKQNTLTLNPDKTTCTLFTTDPAEYKSNLDLKINNTALPMAMHPKVLGLTLDSKLTYSTHIHNISVQAHNPLASSTSINIRQVMQKAALRTATGCTQTYNICMTNHSHFPYTSIYSSTPLNSKRKHNIHHIPYTKIQHTSTLQG